MRSLLKRRLAAEAINFQKLDFFSELVFLFEKAKQIPPNPDNDSYFNNEVFTDITWCIKDYTGLMCVFDDGDWASYCPRFRDNHALDDDLIRFKQKIKELDDGSIHVQEWFKQTNTTHVLGGVDLKLGRVHGIYQHLAYLILMPKRELYGTTFTAQEAAAVLLHEIGHIFTYCEYMNRVVTTNVFLAGLKMVSSLGHEVRVDYIHNACDALVISEEEKQAILSVTSMDAVVYILAQQEPVRSVSELGENVYDSISSEALADQYVARYGAARYLASWLVKSNKDYRAYYTSQARVISEVGDILDFCLGALSTLGYSLYSLLRVTKYRSGRFGVYDDDTTRISRLKHECIEHLKDKRASQRTRLRLLEDIEVLGKLEKVEVVERHWFEKVLFFFKPGEKKRADFERLQKELEAIANNRLFVSAGRLNSYVIAKKETKP